MRKKTFIYFIIFIPIVYFLLLLVLGYYFDKLMGRDESIQDKLRMLKENEFILNYQNFYWEYDFKSIASFDVKFVNGKIGGFHYAKLENERIEFEQMREYDGYIIYGYKIRKETNEIALQLGIENNFNIISVEDVVENLADIDEMINKMPILEMEYPPNIYANDFLLNLQDKVHYEDDDEKIIFFRIKSSK